MTKIVCAANKHVKGDIIILGARHFDKHMRSQIEAYNRSPKNQFWIQGFIDNKGNFLDRKEAYKVAKKANQIIKKTGAEGSEELFSEDLY